VIGPGCFQYPLQGSETLFGSGIRLSQFHHRHKQLRLFLGKLLPGFVSLFVGLRRASKRFHGIVVSHLGGRMGLLHGRELLAEPDCWLYFVSICMGPTGHKEQQNERK
jgi:hypothetical protein